MSTSLSKFPALEALLHAFGPRIRFAEVVVSTDADGWDIRHHRDAAALESDLIPLSPPALREWAQSSSEGAFRPNKLAPSLRSGWFCRVKTPEDLEEALRHLYPGGLADWYAEHRGTKPTSFREFFARQTGMYRIAQQLSDDQAARAVRANCAPVGCKRRRIWDVPGLAPDNPEETSVIPCFEPCGILMEMARRAMKMEQGSHVNLRMPEDDLATALAAIDRALASPDRDVREGDLSAPGNPRRLRLLRERLMAARNENSVSTTVTVS